MGIFNSATPQRDVVVIVYPLSDCLRQEQVDVLENAAMRLVQHEIAERPIRMDETLLS